MRRKRGLSFRYRRTGGGSGTSYSSAHQPRFSTTVTETKHQYAPTSSSGAKPNRTGTTTTRRTTTTGGDVIATGARSSGYKSFTVSPPNVSLTSTPSVVILLGGTLLVFATWDNFWSPFFTTLWTNKKTSGKHPIPGNLIIGGIIAIVVLGVIASMSPGAGGMVMLTILAAWVLFITMHGTGSFGNFLEYFSTSPAAPATHPAGNVKPASLAFYKPLGAK